MRRRRLIAATTDATEATDATDATARQSGAGRNSAGSPSA
jgi:hypothetical protein